MKTFSFITQIENTTDEHGETPAKQGITALSGRKQTIKSKGKDTKQVQ